MFFFSHFCAAISTTDGTATAPDDFTAKTAETLAVAAGATESIVVDITSDTVFESSEMFTVTISGDGVGVVRPMSTITITDDDGKK